MSTKEYMPQSVPHPGETISELLVERNISVGEFSKLVKKSPEVINDLINKNKSVTYELAVAFERVTHIPAKWWLQNQKTYDTFYSK
ncbi:hypothetical protein [Microcystis phage Mel-JY01]